MDPLGLHVKGPRQIGSPGPPRTARHDVIGAGQQRGAFVPWRTMVREDSGGVAFCCGQEGTNGVRLVVFVAVDPEPSVVPVSL